MSTLHTGKAQNLGSAVSFDYSKNFASLSIAEVVQSDSFFARLMNFENDNYLNQVLIRNDHFTMDQFRKFHFYVNKRARQSQKLNFLIPALLL